MRSPPPVPALLFEELVSAMGERFDFITSLPEKYTNNTNASVHVIISHSTSEKGNARTREANARVRGALCVHVGWGLVGGCVCNHLCCLCPARATCSCVEGTKRASSGLEVMNGSIVTPLASAYCQHGASDEVNIVKGTIKRMAKETI